MISLSLSMRTPTSAGPSNPGCRLRDISDTTQYVLQAVCSIGAKGPQRDLILKTNQSMGPKSVSSHVAATALSVVGCGGSLASRIAVNLSPA